MTRGELTERILIVSQVETTDSEVSNTSTATGIKRKACAKVVTVSGQKSFVLGLNPMATNVTITTYDKVTPGDVVEWRGITFNIGALNPVITRHGTYYELTCSAQDAI